MKMVGKPCEGEPQARFDEGALVTGYGTPSEALPDERGSNGWDVPVATEPALYSTRALKVPPDLRVKPPSG